MDYFRLILLNNYINHMKKIISRILITVVLLLGSSFAMSANTVNNDWSQVIKAIGYVESRWNPKAVSPCGRWVGYLQISKEMVLCCNRIVGYQKYSFEDRFDKNKSIEMFYLFQNKYNPNGDIEKGIRMWNGGPRYKIQSTNGYYNKVMKKYTEIIKES